MKPLVYRTEKCGNKSVQSDGADHFLIFISITQNFLLLCKTGKLFKSACLIFT